MEYDELAELADNVLEISGDEEECLAEVLDTLEEGLRTELLTSDFLNAYQTFFYFFRTIPDALVRERLILTPAAEVQDGILVEEVDLLQIIFLVKGGKPHIAIGDGEKPLQIFTGQDAYRTALEAVEELLCRG